MGEAPTLVELALWWETTPNNNQVDECVVSMLMVPVGKVLDGSLRRRLSAS